MPLPECLGTVVVHQNDAVTCTRDTCPIDVSAETWFSHHSSFMTCNTDNCPHCVFDALVKLGQEDNDSASSESIRRRRRGRVLEPAFRRRVSS